MDGNFKCSREQSSEFKDDEGIRFRVSEGPILIIKVNWRDCCAWRAAGHFFVIFCGHAALPPNPASSEPPRTP